MPTRCAVLDDYQNVALQLADWASLPDTVVEVFNRPIGAQTAVIEALQGFAVVCLMRERTPFPRAVFDGLPDLRLVVTSGMRNAAIDLAAARDRDIPVCGTESPGYPTAELTFGLILELARWIGYENARLKAGAWWQSTLGVELGGRTLGVVGLGKLGAKVSALAKAFGMNVIAWSPNLTAERCKEVGVGYASKEELFSAADIVTVHVVLSQRSRGLVGADDLARMKPTAYLVNTARGPIVDESALLETLKARRIAGAAVDVFSVEPLPVDHPFRKLDNMVLTPHLGYTTEETFRAHYSQMVECIDAWFSGETPPRRLA